MGKGVGWGLRLKLKCTEVIRNSNKASLSWRKMRGRRVPHRILAHYSPVTIMMIMMMMMTMTLVINIVICSVYATVD